MKEYLDLATRLAEQAGEITLKYFGTRLNVETKDDLSPVTIADRSAEEYIRGEIEKRFPDDGIFGEEFGEKTGRSGIRWVIDPIDGTKSFIRGVAMYGTMIAVEKDGRSEVGVVRFPPNRQTLAAMNAAGCTCNGEKCVVSSTSSLAEATVLTTSPDHFLQYIGEQPFLRLIRSTKIQRTWGDCYGYLLVATGQADVMIDPIMHRWDVAPLTPIIQESGGQITDIHGSTDPAIVNTVATNKLLHEELLRLLK